MSNSLWPCSNPRPWSQWCHPTISSSVTPFSSCLQSFPASGSFPVSRLFTSGGQHIGASASASVLPMNIQGWFPLELIGCIFLLFKGTLKSLLQHHRLRDEDILEICWETMWICSTQRRRQWRPTPVLSPGKSHGWRSLVGCGPWRRYESDTTEQLHFHFSLSCIGGGNGSPLQCSCLENPRDGGAWWAAVNGIAQSRTWLKLLSSSSSTQTWLRWQIL